MTPAEVDLSFQRALLFQVLPVTCFIYIVSVTATKLALRIYNERLLTVAERDVYYAVAGEMAGDFNDVDVLAYFFVETRPYQPSHYVGRLVYARHEA